MGRKPRPWPSHGKAKEARDEAAGRFYEVLIEMDYLQRLLEQGTLTRLDVAISISRSRKAAGEGLTRLIEQGAPYRPPEVSPEE